MGSEYVKQVGLETDEGFERIKAAFGVNHDRLMDLKTSTIRRTCSVITRTSGRGCRIVRKGAGNVLCPTDANRGRRCSNTPKDRDNHFLSPRVVGRARRYWFEE
jgi:hypothetical protein